MSWKWEDIWEVDVDSECIDNAKALRALLRPTLKKLKIDFTDPWGVNMVRVCEEGGMSFVSLCDG